MGLKTPPKRSVIRFHQYNHDNVKRKKTIHVNYHDHKNNNNNNNNNNKFQKQKNNKIRIMTIKCNTVTHPEAATGDKHYMNSEHNYSITTANTIPPSLPSPTTPSKMTSSKMTSSKMTSSNIRIKSKTSLTNNTEATKRVAKGKDKVAINEIGKKLLREAERVRSHERPVITRDRFDIECVQAFNEYARYLEHVNPICSPEAVDTAEKLMLNLGMI